MNTGFSRRTFLSTSALALVAAGTGVLALHAEASENFAAPHLKFPESARDRLAVASWPFRAYINAPGNADRDPVLPGMDLREFPAWVKKHFNVTAIEPLSDHFASTEHSYVAALRESMEKAGMRVVNIPVDNGLSYYDAEASVRQKVVDNGKRWVDTAQTLGSPSIRTSIAPAKNATPDVDIVAAELRQLADYAAEKNIVVNLENDNLVSEDAFFVVKVIEKANHPYLHALPDFCNSMQTGNEKFNTDALAQLFPHAYNICHVKDSESTEDHKVVRVDLKKIFAILKASYYRGYLSMEWEGQGSPMEGTSKLIDASLEYL